MKKLHLLIVDPQNDFCDPDGALAVPGADKDMERLANMIHRLEKHISEIHCTLDTHHFFDISHPIFWTDANGKHPLPFTIITIADVENGIWKAAIPYHQEYASDYVARLEVNNRYPLCIWQPHCLIGTPGNNVIPVLADALLAWEKNQVKIVNYIMKGINYKTEHYSAVQADVPDPGDLATMMNYNLIERLGQADMIVFAGEALSHCLRFTVEDIVNEVSAAHVRKMVLLTDCASSVPGFEQQGEAFVKDMTAKGIRMMNSKDLGDF